MRLFRRFSLQLQAPFFFTEFALLFRCAYLQLHHRFNCKLIASSLAHAWSSARRRQGGAASRPVSQAAGRAALNMAGARVIICHGAAAVYFRISRHTPHAPLAALLCNYCGKWFVCILITAAKSQVWPRLDSDCDTHYPHPLTVHLPYQFRDSVSKLQL